METCAVVNPLCSASFLLVVTSEIGAVMLRGLTCTVSMLVPDVYKCVPSHTDLNCAAQRKYRPNPINHGQSDGGWCCESPHWWA